MLAIAEARIARRLCLAFGGPITTPEDLEQVFRSSEIHGFAGGSVFERLPVQSVLTSTVRRFKSIAVGRGENPRRLRTRRDGRPQRGMQEVFQLIRQVAPHDVNVCIEGETGTGKELVAMQLHRLSNRSSRPFITLNCGAIPESLLESELFGHEKGAFTSADRRRLGKFELAQGGTLFLDEIADLSPRGQVALLRAIQQREITRVGGDHSLAIDVRIIAASNQSLAEAVRKKRFREDLYYRLNYITIAVPPLRERTDDLPLLTKDILARLQIQLDRKSVGLSPSFQEKIARHALAGKCARIGARARPSGASGRTVGFGRALFHAVPLAEEEACLESNGNGASVADRKTQVREAIAQSGGKSRAAAMLGITRKTLYAWLYDE